MKQPLFEQLGLTALEFDQKIAEGYQVVQFRGRPALVLDPDLYAKTLALARAKADGQPQAKKKTKRGRRG